LTRASARVAVLLAGLVLYGFSMALMIRAGLGLDPWDVFHQGLSRRTGMSIGTATAVVGVVVLLAWIPLRNRPGVGTVANVVVISVTVDVCLAVLPEASTPAVQVAWMLAAVVLNALATVLYIGAGLGPGPRDGLMTGLVARTGRSVRLVRTGIEATVLTAGWLLGGTVGVGTVVYALGIGPLVQLFMWLGNVVVAGRTERDVPFRGVAGPNRRGAPRVAAPAEYGTMVACPKKTRPRV
jgi:uncharacterized membrane protein YczE